MSKMIYNVLMIDKAMDETDILVAFESETIAEDWLSDYIRENYDSTTEMEEAGIELTIEPTIYHKGIVV